MKKLLLADNVDMNRSIVHEIFASQYEIMETSSSEAVFRLLMHYKNEISIILINESVANNFTKETVQTLANMEIFKNIPSILILEGELTQRSKAMNMNFPYCDVLTSPVNPYIIRKRVANLVELYSHKNELEDKVEKQTARILIQNQALRLQERKISTINNDMLDTLSTVIEYRDVESGRHIHRIKKFTEVMLKALSVKYPKYNMTKEKMAMIASASALHDIGKIAIPDSILLSPRRLTYEEFNIMKTHTIKGCELLNHLDGVEKNEYFTYCYDICRYHHEKYDGKGYPDGLVGDSIPIWAQVVSVADCYDALTSERSYKAALTHEQAVEMMRSGACGVFSDEMMVCFSMVLSDFKSLAEEYADENHVDRSVNDFAEEPFNVGFDGETADVLYKGMGRNELIQTIESQKKEMQQSRKKSFEILNKISDYVFEFDLKNETANECKGMFKSILDYYPKNYSEAVMLFSRLCPDEYRISFGRTFRLDNIENEINNGKDRLVLECPMCLNGKVYSFVRCTAVPVADEKDIVKIFVSLETLKYREGHSEENAADHNRDSVTGLWNFNGLRDEINDYIGHTGRNSSHLLMVIDVDGFGVINRKTGYRFGNEILNDIADILKSNLKGSLIGRVEDDNFAVLFKDCVNRDENIRLVDKLFKKLHRTYTFDGKTYHEISVCIGASMYPENGRDFEELFYNASKAIDVAKINGKNMYLFYNPGMRNMWSIAPYQKKELDKKENCDIEFESLFVPIVDSVGDRVISYEMVETTSEYAETFNFDEIYSALYHTDSITAYSLDSLRRMFAEIYKLEKSGRALPRITIMTMFKGKDYDIVIKAIDEMLLYYPISCKNICISITHDMLKNMDMRQTVKFIDYLAGRGFSAGVYNVGLGGIDIKCFINGLFSSVSFSNLLIEDIGGGLIPISTILCLLECFKNTNIQMLMPMNVNEDVLRQIKQKTDVVFGIHKNEFLDVESFGRAVDSDGIITEYKALDYTKNSLVPNEKLYNEILIQTKSFIMEWAPRTDCIKLSDSFESLYGYIPDSFDFVSNLRSRKFLHPDDIRKFLEKLNFSRSDVSKSECLIRVYNPKKDRYIWNRVRFAAARNAAGAATKIMVVFADISDESEAYTDDESRRDRTDYITKLYNRTASENKIKTYLYGDGAALPNALITVEICGFDEMERSLGKVFANAVLKEIASNIQELFSDYDILGRISGSQFMVFVKGINNKEILEMKAGQICSAVRHSYETDSGSVPIYAKLGISTYPNCGRSYDELYEAAQNALYYAKHSVTKDFSIDISK